MIVGESRDISIQTNVSTVCQMQTTKCNHLENCIRWHFEVNCYLQKSTLYCSIEFLHPQQFLLSDDGNTIRWCTGYDEKNNEVEAILKEEINRFLEK